MIQAFFRQSSALGLFCDSGCRTSPRKSTQAPLKPLSLTAWGGVDALKAYLHTYWRLLNRRLPANIRYKIHPRDQMSIRLVMGFTVSLPSSGAM